MAQKAGGGMKHPAFAADSPATQHRPVERQRLADAQKRSKNAPQVALASNPVFSAADQNNPGSASNSPMSVDPYDNSAYQQDRYGSAHDEGYI
jgi:hypothetical protein